MAKIGEYDISFGGAEKTSTGKSAWDYVKGGAEAVGELGQDILEAPYDVIQKTGEVIQWDWLANVGKSWEELVNPSEQNTTAEARGEEKKEKTPEEIASEQAKTDKEKAEKTANQSAEDLKAKGAEVRKDLTKAGEDYKAAMDKLAEPAEKAAFDANQKFNKSMDSLSGLSAELTRLRSEGAVDSPLVQRQIAAYNAEVDAAAKQAEAQISAEMAQRGFSGSNEDTMIRAQMRADIGRAKATGAEEIENKNIEFATSQVELQGRMLMFSADEFNQVAQFEGARAATFRAAGEERKSDLAIAGIQAEADFFKTGEAIELGGAEFAANMGMQLNTLAQ